MIFVKKKHSVVIMIVSYLLSSGYVYAESDPGDEAKQAAKVARLKARQRHSSYEENGTDDKSLTKRSGDVVGNCGSVNVGNVVNEKNVRTPKTEVTVVITGDVINTNNKCNKQ